MAVLGWRTPSPRALGSLALITFLITVYFTPIPATATDKLRSYGYPPFSYSAPSPSSHDPSALWPAPPPSPAALGHRLLSRLDALLSSPIATYDESARRQRARCPVSHEQSNQDQINGEGDFWRDVKASVLQAKREKVAAGLRARLGLDESWTESALDAEGWAALFGNGEKGIVMTGGNGDTANRLLTTLKILRGRHGCALPVEVFAYPDEQDLGGLRDKIEALGDVSVREIEAQREGGVWKQFQLKGEAIARSSFTDILYLDSDNIPIRDPSYLFESASFREHGYVLWPDFSKDSAVNPIWRLTNTDCNPDQWQAESGQVLVSKTARGGVNLAALLVAYELNSDIDFWYKLSGGDKDTFRYATFFLGVDYTAISTYSGSVGSIVPVHDGHTFCGIAMLQHGLAPDEWQLPDVQDRLRPEFVLPSQPPPLFMHANLLKHSSGNRPGASFSLVKYPDDDVAFLRTDLRFKVSMYRGMCTDVWDGSPSLDGGAGNHGDGAEMGSFELGKVTIEDATEAYGGLLAGFEDMYFEEGGKAGGY